VLWGVAQTVVLSEKPVFPRRTQVASERVSALVRVPGGETILGGQGQVCAIDDPKQSLIERSPIIVGGHRRVLGFWLVM
jgi:hypothetical protein